MTRGCGHGAAMLPDDIHRAAALRLDDRSLSVGGMTAGRGHGRVTKAGSRRARTWPARPPLDGAVAPP